MVGLIVPKYFDYILELALGGVGLSPVNIGTCLDWIKCKERDRDG